MVQDIKNEMEQLLEHTKGELNERYSELYRRELVVNVSFSIGILIFGEVFKIFAVMLTDDENWRY